MSHLRKMYLEIPHPEEFDHPVNQHKVWIVLQDEAIGYVKKREGKKRPWLAVMEYLDSEEIKPPKFRDLEEVVEWLTQNWKAIVAYEGKSWKEPCPTCRGAKQVLRRDGKEFILCFTCYGEGITGPARKTAREMNRLAITELSPQEAGTWRYG